MTTPPSDPPPANPSATATPPAVSELLLVSGAGDAAALEALIPIVYAELRAQARRAMRREAPGHTLQTTALVHETFLRHVDQRRVAW